MYISRVSFTAVNLWAMIKYDIIQATFIKLFFEAIWSLIRVLIFYLEVPHLDPWILFSMTQFQFCNVVHFYSFWAETFWQKMKKYQYLHILIYLVFIVLCEFPFFSWDASGLYISIFLSKEHIHMNSEYMSKF